MDLDNMVGIDCESREDGEWGRAEQQGKIETTVIEQQ